MANLGIQIKGVRSLGKWNIFLVTKSPKILQLLKKATKTKSKLRTPDFLKQPYMLQKQTF